MPRLIHLNGPSRVGKSTLARRYADDHPGCLRVDLDELTGMVGGWRHDLSAALDVARPLGWAMAARHLRDGHDVIVPQLLTSHDEAPGPDVVAHEAGADYLEVVLLVDRAEHRRRVMAKRPGSTVEREIQDALEDPGRDLVGLIRQHLEEHLASRPAAVLLDTTGLDEDTMYARLLDALRNG